MAKRQGLVLTLGNAPTTPHFIPGIPGYYRPNIPTPVGGEGEVPLELAKKLDKGNEELKLVEIPASQVAQAEATAKKDREDARRGVLTARQQDPQGHERALVKQAQAAASEGGK